MIQKGGADYKKWIKLGLAGIGLVITLFFLLISLPAAPIIIYLTILFQVIKLMWEKLKEL